MSELLQQHQERKIQLIELLNRSKQHFLTIEEPEKASNFDQYIHDLQEGDFSIVVVGEFSAGKSTFLNAMMGDRYLPSFSKETTATINFLKHTSKSPNGHSLQIDYKDPSVPTKFTEATKEEIAKNVSTVGGDRVVQDIESVTLYLNSPLLEHGITLVDSPGLNGIKDGHAEVTERQIERSHACIYMFQAGQPGSKSDFEILAKLSERFDNIFLVLNQIDKIKQSEETVESVVESLCASYAKYFPEKALPEIYPLAAYPALVARTKENLEYPDNSGKKDHDAETRLDFLQRSRIEQFEQRLWRFITGGDKTLQELKVPAQIVEHELTKRMEYINDMVESINGEKDTEEIEKQQQSIQHELIKIQEQLEKEKLTIEHDVSEIIDDIENSVKTQSDLLRKKYNSQLSTVNDLQSVDIQIQRINKRLQQDCETLLAEIDDELSTSIKRKIMTKYNEMAVVMNKELAETGQTTTTFKNLQFETNTDIQIDMSDYDSKTEQLNEQIEALREQANNTEVKKLEAIKVKRELRHLEEKREKIMEEEMHRMSLLGGRPNVDRYTKQKEVVEESSGLFGKVRKFFKGEKTTFVQEEVINRDAQNAYDEERKRIREEMQAKEAEIARQLAQTVSGQVTDPEIYELQMKQLRDNEERLQQERERYLQTYKEKIEKENETLLHRVRQDFEDFIEEAEKQISKTIRSEIKNKKDVITNIIVTTIEQQFQKQIEQKEAELQQLQEIINSGEAEKADMRTKLLAEKEQLKEIAKDAITFISALEQIEPDVIAHTVYQTI